MIKEFGRKHCFQEREPHRDCPPRFTSAVTIVVLCRWLTLSDSLFFVQSLGRKESAWWCRNNVITTDRFSYEPSACIDCAPHTHKTNTPTWWPCSAGCKSDVFNVSLVLFLWRRGGLTGFALLPRRCLPGRHQPLPVKLSRPLPSDLWPCVQISQPQQSADGSALGIARSWW